MKRRLIGILLLITMFTMLCPVSIYAKDNSFVLDLTQLQADTYNADGYTKVNDMLYIRSSVDYIADDGITMTKSNNVKIKLVPTVDGTIAVTYDGGKLIMPEYEVRTGSEETFESDALMQVSAGSEYYIQGSASSESKVSQIVFSEKTSESKSFVLSFVDLNSDDYNSEGYTALNDMVSMKTSSEYVLSDGVYLTKSNDVRIKITPSVNGTVTVMFGGKAPVMSETELRTGTETSLESGVSVEVCVGKSYYLQSASKDQTRITEIRFDATPTVAPTATPTVAPTATPTVAPTVTPTAAPTATPTAAPTVMPNPYTSIVVLSDLSANEYNSSEYVAVNEWLSIKAASEYICDDGAYLDKKNGVKIKITPTVNGTITVTFRGKAPVMPETELRTGTETGLESGVPIEVYAGKEYYLQGSASDLCIVEQIEYTKSEDEIAEPTSTPTPGETSKPDTTPDPSVTPVPTLTTNKLNVTEYEAGTYEYANGNVFPQSGTKRAVVSDLNISTKGTHISFDFTMNTLLKEDSKSDTEKVYDTFGLEFTNNVTKGGGVLVAGKQVGDNAMTFKWRSGKTTWTLPDAYALEVGKTYTFDFLVKEGVTSSSGVTTYPLDLTIYNRDGTMLAQANDLTCRAANGKAKIIYITATPRTVGEKDSVTISNLHTYLAGPQGSVLTQNELNGSYALDTDTEYIVTPNKFSATSLRFEKPYAVDAEGNELAYISTSLYATLKDGEELPEEISFENNTLTIDSGLEAGEYDVVLSVSCTYNGELCAIYSYNIKINKEEVSADDIINEFTPEITSNGTAVLDGAQITDNIVLQQGSTVVNVSWSSSNSDVISDDGIVTRPLEDTTVTLTANVSSVSEPSKAKIYSITVTVKGVGEILNDALSKAVDGLVSADDETKVMSSEILADLHEDIKLVTKYADDENVAYTWSSDNKYLKIEDDIAAIYPLSQDEYNAVLTVKATYGVIDLTREIPIKINLTKENAADKYAVRCDNLIEDNFEKVAQYEGKTISKNITVPTKGVFGSTISWTSSAPMYLSNTGSYTAPSSSKTLTMTAIVSKGKIVADEQHSYEMTLKGKSTSSSGGGGGSSSGSIGKVTSSYTAPVSTATSNVTNSYVTYDTPIQAQGFADISDVEWANEAINKLADKKIVSGRSNTIFAPNDNITRAEFIKIVMNAFDLTDENAQSVSFSDVNENDWYYVYVASAYAKGIVSGYSDGSFGVNDNITRQDMAVIIYRAANVANIVLDEVREMPELADTDTIADYAKEAVTVLYKAEVINGMSDTEFAPLSFATRAQAAKMIYEIVK